MNLGYDWYRKDSESSFAFGVREAETEADPRYAGRARRTIAGGGGRILPFATRGLGHGNGCQYTCTLAANLATRHLSRHWRIREGITTSRCQVTRSWRLTLMPFPALQRFERMGRLQDFEVVKAAGINIYAPIDGSGSGGGSGGGTAAAAGDRLKDLSFYYDVARRYSDKNFIMMPNEELAFGELSALGREIGGHNDLFVSHPIYWLPTRANGQPLVEDNPTYGKVYHIGSPADLMEMTHREDLILYMPHPRSKGSQGYPDGIKDTAQFRDENFRGIGFRWGMGVDGSETRLCEYRCLPTFDDMNNWVADLPTPPKYVQAITETYQQEPSDDVYANSPVNYLKLDALPGLDGWKPIVDTMKRGDYFVTSGASTDSQLRCAGDRQSADDCGGCRDGPSRWKFAEVVWGDGQKTDRQIIPATDLPAFGKHHFQIPFDATGKKWVRVAVWDSAGNGALVQPIKLPSGLSENRRA